MTKTVRCNFCGTQQAVFRWKTPWRTCAAAFSPWLSACSFPAESLELPGLSMHESKRGTQRKERQKNTQLKNLFLSPFCQHRKPRGFGHFWVDTDESRRNGTGCVFIIAGRKKRVLSACRDEFCAGAELHKILKKFVKVFSQEQSNHIPEIVETDPAGII